MNILLFEHNNFGMEDICETLKQMGHQYKRISTILIYERVSTEFDQLFEEAMNTHEHYIDFARAQVPYIAHVQSLLFPAQNSSHLLSLEINH